MQSMANFTWLGSTNEHCESKFKTARTSKGPIPMRVVTYARKSKGEGGVSWQHQLELAREFCDQMGWDVVLEFHCADGSKGKDDDPRIRPGLYEMEQHLHGIDAIVVQDLDRISRHDVYGPVHQLRFFEAGVQLWSYAHKCEIPFKTAKDRFMSGMKSFTASEEVEQASSRTRPRLEYRAKRGWATGPAPYGYLSRYHWRNGKATVGKDTKPANYLIDHVEWVVDESKKHEIIGMFEMYRDQYGYTVINRTLNGDPMFEKLASQYFGRARTANDWAPSPPTVRAMLRNSKYVGVVTWAKTKRQEKAGRTDHKVPADLKDVIKVQVLELQIVPTDLWYAVQQRIKDNPHYGHRPESGKEKTLLSGIVKCAACGSSMVRTGRSYQCYRYITRGGTKCSNRARHNEVKTNTLFLTHVKDQLLNKEFIDDVYSAYRARKPAKHEHQPEIKKAERELKKLLDAIDGMDKVPQSIVCKIQEKEDVLEELRARVPAKRKRAEFRSKSDLKALCQRTPKPEKSPPSAAHVKGRESQPEVGRQKNLWPVRHR